MKVDIQKLVELTTQATPQAATHWSTRTMGAQLGVSASTVMRHWQAKEKGRTKTGVRYNSDELATLTLFSATERLSQPTRRIPKGRCLQPFFVLEGQGMYLLYLDDSGSPSDPNQKFFVMAGVCVFERQTQLARRPTDSDSEALSCRSAASGNAWQPHAFGGRRLEKAFLPNDRAQAVVDALNLLSDTQMEMKVFACIVEKAKFNPEEIVPHAFEEIATQRRRAAYLPTKMATGTRANDGA